MPAVPFGLGEPLTFWDFGGRSRALTGWLRPLRLLDLHGLGALGSEVAGSQVTQRQFGKGEDRPISELR